MRGPGKGDFRGLGEWGTGATIHRVILFPHIPFIPYVLPIILALNTERMRNEMSAVRR